MSRTTYHVTQKSDGTWQGKAEGAGRASTTRETKAEAVRATTDIAKNLPLSQVVIHKARAHGSAIQTEYTYGKDPRRFPG